MLTSKVWTDESKLLQESNLAARQPHGAPHHIIQATINEKLAQGPYVAARGGVELATFRTEGTEHHHSTTTPHIHIVNALLNQYNNLHDKWDISWWNLILANLITSMFHMFDKLWESCFWCPSLHTVLLAMNTTRYCCVVHHLSLANYRLVYSRKGRMFCIIYFPSQVLKGIKGISCVTFRVYTISRVQVGVVREFPFLLSEPCHVQYSWWK